MDRAGAREDLCDFVARRVHCIPELEVALVRVRGVVRFEAHECAWLPVVVDALRSVRFERRCAIRLRPIRPAELGSVVSASRVLSMVPSARKTEAPSTTSIDPLLVMMRLMRRPRRSRRMT